MGNKKKRGLVAFVAIVVFLALALIATASPDVIYVSESNGTNDIAHTSITRGDFSDWHYTRTICIKENSGNNLTDYQVLIVLSGTDFPVEANESGADIRFVDENENVLNYWIEEYNYTAKKAMVWVKVPTLLANETATLQMY